MDNATTVVSIRMPFHERSALKLRAESAGMTMSTYARLLLRADARIVDASMEQTSFLDAPYFYLVTPQSIIELASQVRRFGQQYNQAVFGLNKLLKLPYPKVHQVTDTAVMALSIVEKINTKMESVETLTKAIERERARELFLYPDGGAF